MRALAAPLAPTWALGALFGCSQAPLVTPMDNEPCGWLAGTVCPWMSTDPRSSDVTTFPVVEIGASNVGAVIGVVGYDLLWISPPDSFWRRSTDIPVEGSVVFTFANWVGDPKMAPIPDKPGRVSISGGYGFELDMPSSVARAQWEGYTFEVLPASGHCEPPFGALRTAYAADGTAYAADEFAIWRMDDDKVARLVAGTPCVDGDAFGDPPPPGPAVGGLLQMGNDHGFGSNVVIEPWLYITSPIRYSIVRVDLDHATLETWEWDWPMPRFTVGDIERGPRGELYLVDGEGACIWVVEPDGAARVFAGTCGEPGSSGDGGSADEAQFEYISSITIDPAGYLYICDPYAQNIRRVWLGP